MSKRRLAAIMFTDIVGYDSLLKEDEKKAFEILRKNQRIHKRLIKKFNGRWLKEMESGTLASFSSVIDAVMCALFIQKATEEITIPIRIGLHQGEVIFEKNDVLGDGVNIASRIHSLIDTQGIIISDTVYKDIKNKEGLNFESLGSQELKGVDSSVGVYKINCKDYKQLDFTIDSGELVSPLNFRRSTLFAGILIIALLAFAGYYFLPKFTQKSSKLGNSVLILPFDNYLGTDTLDYFVAGMHDALISNIGQVSALNVKSKTTANAIKNTDKSIPEIAKELGINTFIETGVLCIGDSLCLQMKIFDQDENELWIYDFKVERSQILSLYNNVSKNIADRINVALTPQEERFLTRSRTVDPDAYDTYLKGWFYLNKFDPDSLDRSLDYFNLAIEKDPEWADPYAALAYTWNLYGTSLKIFPKSVTLPKVYQYLNKALELDPKSAQAHYVKACAAVWNEFDWKKGEEEFLLSLELNPNDAHCRMNYSHLLAILGRSDEAVNQANLALDRDPMKPLMLALYAATMELNGNIQSAKSYLGKALSIDPGYHRAKFTLTHFYMREAYMNGEYEKWIELWDKKVEALGHWNAEGRASVLRAFHEKGHIAAIEEMFRMNEKYGDECWMAGRIKALRYIDLNDYEKAMDCLEEEYEIRDHYMAGIGTDLYLREHLIDNPRYIALLKKMKLPLP
jgi:TolB-like protein